MCFYPQKNLFLEIFFKNYQIFVTKREERTPKYLAEVQRMQLEKRERTRVLFDVVLPELREIIRETFTKANSDSGNSDSSRSIYRPITESVFLTKIKDSGAFKAWGNTTKAKVSYYHYPYDYYAEQNRIRRGKTANDTEPVQKNP